MKTIITSFTFLVITATAFSQKNKKAVFVIVDGISSDVVEKLSTPHLDAIAKAGGYTKAHVGGEKDRSGGVQCL